MSEKINELVLMVKQHMHLGEKEAENSIRQIQNQIDDKNLQIRDIFSRNITSVIDHYVRHQEIMSSQKRLENHCEEFSKRIQKTQNLSEYDERMLERSQNTIQGLRAKKIEISNMRECVSGLRKAAICIQEGKYNQAIKLLNSYKEHQPKTDIPLKKSLGIFREKIKVHLLKLVQNFWETNKAKILDLGALCYSKVQLSTHEKTNIYQAFFGRNSAARNSLIRRSSIVEEGRMEAPLRFLKKVKDEEILQKYILRLNIDMNALKQMRVLCKEMQEQGLFETLINRQMRQLVADLAEERPADTEAELKGLLAAYVGFLLFWRQIVAFFGIQGEGKLLFGQMYGLVGKAGQNLVQRPEHLGQILKVKQHFDIFHKVLEIVNLDRQNIAFGRVLEGIFKIYCRFSLEQYQAILGEQISDDNLTFFTADDRYQEDMIDQVLSVRPDHTGHYNFTRFVVYTLQIFNQFYDHMVSFVKDTELSKNQLHEHLSSLFERIIAIYCGVLVVNEQPLQIAQGELNLSFCESILKHYSEQLEIKYEYIRTSQPAYKPKLEAAIVQLRRQMREVVQDKILEIMCSYQQDYTWIPANINNSPNQFVNWMLQFVKQMVLNLRKINHPAHQEMALSWAAYIAHLYWDYFELCKQFTLITIYNLDQDLLAIYKFFSRHLGFYHSLPDKFKSLSEFYALMLTNNINDLLEKNKRDISYGHLDLYKIVPILKKYNKAKSNCGGKIRQLKKKDVEVLVKKLETQLALNNN